VNCELIRHGIRRNGNLLLFGAPHRRGEYEEDEEENGVK
jgi:hypothetical protein